MRIKDISGKKINNLTVIKYHHTQDRGQTYWVVKCICGKEKIVRKSHILSGGTYSCGCYGRKQASIRLKKYTTSKSYKGRGNPAWKGDNITIGSIHSWLLKNFTKRKNCDHCNKIKKLDFALKKNYKYSRNIKDYLHLCRSCHLKYDFTQERKVKMILTRKKNNAS